MATWESTGLPGLVHDGYSEEIQDPLIRSKMSYGPDKVRKRTTAVIRTFSQKLVLTYAQYETLKTFYETTTNFGSDTFTRNHFNGVSKTMRFTAPPKLSNFASQNHLEVDISMEILP